MVFSLHDYVFQKLISVGNKKFQIHFCAFIEASGQPADEPQWWNFSKMSQHFGNFLGACFEGSTLQIEDTYGLSTCLYCIQFVLYMCKVSLNERPKYTFFRNFRELGPLWHEGAKKSERTNCVYCCCLDVGGQCDQIGRFIYHLGYFWESWVPYFLAELLLILDLVRNLLLAEIR